MNPGRGTTGGPLQTSRLGSLSVVETSIGRLAPLGPIIEHRKRRKRRYDHEHSVNRRKFTTTTKHHHQRGLDGRISSDCQSEIIFQKPKAAARANGNITLADGSRRGKRWRPRARRLWGRRLTEPEMETEPDILPAASVKLNYHCGICAARPVNGPMCLASNSFQSAVIIKKVPRRTIEFESDRSKQNSDRLWPLLLLLLLLKLITPVGLAATCRFLWQLGRAASEADNKDGDDKRTRNTSIRPMGRRRIIITVQLHNETWQATASLQVAIRWFCTNLTGQPTLAGRRDKTQNEIRFIALPRVVVESQPKTIDQRATLGDIRRTHTWRRAARNEQRPFGLASRKDNKADVPFEWSELICKLPCVPLGRHKLTHSDYEVSQGWLDCKSAGICCCKLQIATGQRPLPARYVGHIHAGRRADRRRRVDVGRARGDDVCIGCGGIARSWLLFSFGGPIHEKANECSRNLPFVAWSGGSVVVDIVVAAAAQLCAPRCIGPLISGALLRPATANRRRYSNLHAVVDRHAAQTDRGTKSLLESGHPTTGDGRRRRRRNSSKGLHHQDGAHYRRRCCHYDGPTSGSDCRCYYYNHCEELAAWPVQFQTHCCRPRRYVHLQIEWPLKELATATATTTTITAPPSLLPSPPTRAHCQASKLITETSRAQSSAPPSPPPPPHDTTFKCPARPRAKVHHDDVQATQLNVTPRKKRRRSPSTSSGPRKCPRLAKIKADSGHWLSFRHIAAFAFVLFVCLGSESLLVSGVGQPSIIDAEASKADHWRREAIEVPEQMLGSKSRSRHQQQQQQQEMADNNGNASGIEQDDDKNDNNAESSRWRFSNKTGGPTRHSSDMLQDLSTRETRARRRLTLGAEIVANNITKQEGRRAMTRNDIKPVDLLRPRPRHRATTAGRARFLPQWEPAIDVDHPAMGRLMRSADIYARSAACNNIGATERKAVNSGHAMDLIGRLKHPRRRRRRRRSTSEMASNSSGATSNRARAAYRATQQTNLLFDPSLVNGAQKSQETCSQMCNCVWKQGKHFADCTPGASHDSNRKYETRLDSIPDGLDPLLQVLNLTSNHFLHLPAQVFQKLNLLNLQRLYLSNNHLETIHERAFQRLRLVIELDFSWNKLRQVPLFAIRRLSLLRRLVMRGNPLYALDDKTLSGLPSKSIASSQADDGDRLGEDNTLGEMNYVQPDDLPMTNLSRLYETYPHLVRQLLALYQVASGSGSDGHEKELELLQSIIRQVDQADNDESLLSNSISVDKEEEQDDVEQPNPFDQSNIDANHRRPHSTSLNSFGAYFSHMQELDFGLCNLVYIKWTAFERLDQLKRLHLDGNNLIQLSGKLVASLPANLHQLSLEENPWICDCRLFALKRWLISTRTPLRAPVRCQQKQPPPDTLTRRRRARRTGSSQVYLDQLGLDSFVCPPRIDSVVIASSSASSSPSSAASNRVGPSDENAGRLTPDLRSVLEYLAPSVVEWPAWKDQTLPNRQRDNETSISGEQGTNQQTPTTGKQRSSSAWSIINALTSIQSSAARVATPTKAPSGAKKATNQRKIVQVNEDEQVVLKCPIILYPNLGSNFVWLVDYSPTGDASNYNSNNNASLVAGVSFQINRANKSWGDRFSVLYDSISSSTGDNSNSAEVPNVDAVDESATDAIISAPTNSPTSTSTTTPSTTVELDELFGEQQNQKVITIRANLLGTSRVFALETRLATPHHESIAKESSIIFQTVQLSDAARYKCIALNKAGNSSIEYSLRVARSPNYPPLPSSSSSADSRETMADTTASRTTIDETSSPNSLLHMGLPGSSSSSIRSPHRHQTTGLSPKDQRARDSINQGSYTGQLYDQTSSMSSNNNNNKIIRVQSNKQAQSQDSTQVSSSPSGSIAVASSSSFGPNWPLKGPPASQITIAIVSLLMASVTIAFVFVCVIIYRIKPSGSGNVFSGFYPNQANHSSGQQANQQQIETTLLSTTVTPNGFMVLPGLAGGGGGQIINPSLAMSDQSAMGSTLNSLNGPESLYLAKHQPMQQASICSSGSGNRQIHLITGAYADPMSGQSTML